MYYSFYGKYKAFLFCTNIFFIQGACSFVLFFPFSSPSLEATRLGLTLPIKKSEQNLL